MACRKKNKARTKIGKVMAKVAKGKKLSARDRAVLSRHLDRSKRAKGERRRRKKRR